MPYYSSNKKLLETSAYFKYDRFSTTAVPRVFFFRPRGRGAMASHARRGSRSRGSGRLHRPGLGGQARCGEARRRGDAKRSASISQHEDPHD